VVEPRREGLLMGRAEADIQYRRPMLKLLDQVGLLGTIDDFVEGDVVVP
jgi:hypothetical protein